MPVDRLMVDRLSLSRPLGSDPAPNVPPSTPPLLLLLLPALLLLLLPALLLPLLLSSATRKRALRQVDITRMAAPTRQAVGGQSSGSPLSVAHKHPTLQRTCWLSARCAAGRCGPAWLPAAQPPGSPASWCCTRCRSPSPLLPCAWRRQRRRRA